MNERKIYAYVKAWFVVTLSTLDTVPVIKEKS